jgi:hypothetical protein
MAENAQEILREAIKGIHTHGYTRARWNLDALLEILLKEGALICHPSGAIGSHVLL